MHCEVKVNRILAIRRQVSPGQSTNRHTELENALSCRARERQEGEEEKGEWNVCNMGRDEVIRDRNIVFLRDIFEGDDTNIKR